MRREKPNLFSSQESVTLKRLTFLSSPFLHICNKASLQFSDHQVEEPMVEEEADEEEDDADDALDDHIHSLVDEVGDILEADHKSLRKRVCEREEGSKIEKSKKDRQRKSVTQNRTLNRKMLCLLTSMMLRNWRRTWRRSKAITTNIRRTRTGTLRR